MIKKFGFIILVMISINTYAQGVQFREIGNWEMIKQIASKEKKLILFDFYATWCGPCKAMDEMVYKNQNVGELINNNFISIKIKLDPTAIEKQSNTSWYKQIDEFVKEFNIKSLPTVLVFTSNGQPLTKEIGYVDTLTLVRKLKDVHNTESQYYPKIATYKQGKLKLSEYPIIAIKAKYVGDMDLANNIAKDYSEKYLYKTADSVLFTKENLSFLRSFIVNTKSTSFKLFSNNIDKVNHSLGKNSAQSALRRAITKEYIPGEETWEKNPPNWDSLERIVTKKTGLLGLEAVNGNKMIYYSHKQDWKRCGKAYLQYFQTALERPEYNVNNITYLLVQNSDDLAVLKFARDVVMKYAIEEWYQNDGPAYDTYANLLYRTDRKEEALEWEQRAVKIGKGTPDEGELLENFNKMKMGLPTWNVTSKN